MLPHLKGKLDGFAVRVPTPNVSLVDLVVELEKPATAEEIDNAFKAAADGPSRASWAYSEEELVSSDFVRDPPPPSWTRR